MYNVLFQLKGSNTQLVERLKEMKTKLAKAEQKNTLTLALEKQLVEISRKNDELCTKLDKSNDEGMNMKLKTMEQENSELNAKFKALESRFEVSLTKHQELLQRFEELEDVEKRKTNELIQKQNDVEHLQSRLNEVTHGRPQNGGAKEKSPLRPTKSNMSNICAIL